MIVGIFSALFGKKKTAISKTDRVLVTRTAANHDLVKWIVSALADHKQVTVVWFFKETREELEKLLPPAVNLQWVNGLQVSFIPGAADHHAVIVFAETYPDKETENKLLSGLEQNGYSGRIVFFNALEDPVFIPFGAERIRKMMDLLGVKEDEAIGHRMITSSLDRAQKKISNKKILTRKIGSRAEMVSILSGLK